MEKNDSEKSIVQQLKDEKDKLLAEIDKKIKKFMNPDTDKDIEFF